MTAAHDQNVTKHYVMHFPEHPAREEDPHYKDFEEYRRRNKDTARCQFAVETNDDSECHGTLELHHHFIEFSLQNGVTFERLEYRFKGISDPAKVGEWIESAENLIFLCAFHHRGHGGVHTASAADYEASKWVKGLIE